MNYQLLIHSYSNGNRLTKQEIDLLILELETHIRNLKISNNFGFLDSAPDHICNCLKLKERSYWITCLAEIIDMHQPNKTSRSRANEVYEELLQKGLLIG